MITIALSKGRILEQTLPLLEKVNIKPTIDPNTSRKLIFPTNQPDVQLTIVRATDVPTYVGYGAADLGVAGKDVLIEQGSSNIYEPLDLKIAQCKLMVAGPKNKPAKSTSHIKVATKFVKSTENHFAQKGQQISIIKLYGSMELAPLLGLADKIVDLVDTGNTLKANGLEPEEHITDISSRLIVNKAAMKVKHQKIQTLIDQLRTHIAQ